MVTADSLKVDIVITKKDREFLESIAGLDTTLPLNLDRILEVTRLQWLDLLKRGRRPMPVLQDMLYGNFSRAMRIAPMGRGIMLVAGLPGAGKTTFATRHLWRLKTYFGRPVGMNYHPSPLFGSYTYWDPEFFRQELERISDMVKEGSKKQSLRYNNENDRIRASSLYAGRAWAYDEAPKLLGRRRIMTNVALHMGDTIREWRHYDVLMMLMSQSKKELDNLWVDEYVTHEVDIAKLRNHPEYSEVVVYDRQTMRTRRELLYRPRWYGLFHHDSLVAPRLSHTFKIDDRSPEEKARKKDGSIRPDRNSDRQNT